MIDLLHHFPRARRLETHGTARHRISIASPRSVGGIAVSLLDTLSVTLNPQDVADIDAAVPAESQPPQATYSGRGPEPTVCHTAQFC